MTEPSFDLKRLIKLMGMTTSSVDAEALVALKLANKECEKLGKTWAEILSGKITVIGDPFASMPPPPEVRKPAPPGAPTRAAPPPPRPAYTQSPRPQAAAPPPAYTYTPPTPDPIEALAIPRSKTFHIKEDLKRLGARWDPASRVWKARRSDHPRILSFVNAAAIPQTTSDALNLI